MLNDIVISAARRTPVGSFQGQYAKVPAPVLGSSAIKGALQQANIDPNNIDSVIMGCVLPAGLGQAPARQASLGANIPDSTGCTTINKMCGSGMKAIIFAHDQIKAESHNIMIAGGMENMTRAPYLLDKARSGYRLGHGQLIDHMFYDGLEDAYQKGQLMGCFAEATAKEFNFDRAMQDEFAIRSLQRAHQAQQQGLFQAEICTTQFEHRGKTITIEQDELPPESNIEKIPKLKPAFAKDGTVTAANSSSISDGAAACILMTEDYAKQHKHPIVARIVAHATHAQQPAWFTTAPIAAIKKVLEKAQWTQDSVDLYEINEAFAVVTMAAIKELNLNPEQVNVHGGACALGHPIGASGARIVTTLLSALQQRQLKRGIAALCIGGGEATALALELV